MIVSPVVVPVIATLGGAASSTVIATGVAVPTCPLASEAEASMRIVDPGAAPAGTLNPNVSTRSIAGGFTAFEAASCGLPVCAL